ncbi:unnamed protein product (mitochondrion) [Plasmodiophora brassicae]|uniref:Uncharacterized protein n=1 Tax=Plasmodiophora brassicae TaxID=37360 RepID=A0A0G4IZT1_PLABS|nr:hypothetical protein PBRA_008137 [Plasmodiophora brassicae]SPR01954.1 unnamed protein product [Plasmodiophora brassicae]
MNSSVDDHDKAADVQEIVERATAQLNDAVRQLQDLANEVGGPATDEPGALPADDDATSADNVDGDGIDSTSEAGAAPRKPRSAARTGVWVMAGMGAAVAVAGAVYYFVSRRGHDSAGADVEGDGGMSFQAALMRVARDDSGGGTTTAADTNWAQALADNDDANATMMDRLVTAASFVGNLVVSGIMTSVGEKARDMVADTLPDVQEYIDSAQDAVVGLVQEQVDAVQDAIQEQVGAVQDAIQERVDHAKVALVDVGACQPQGVAVDLIDVAERDDETAGPGQ